jgi:hypothetical protein
VIPFWVLASRTESAHSNPNGQYDKTNPLRHQTIATIRRLSLCGRPDLGHLLFRQTISRTSRSIALQS